jgi:hypothetical protein
MLGPQEQSNSRTDDLFLEPRAKIMGPDFGTVP